MGLLSKVGKAVSNAGKKIGRELGNVIHKPGKAVESAVRTTRDLANDIADSKIVPKELGDIIHLTTTTGTVVTKTVGDILGNLQSEIKLELTQNFRVWHYKENAKEIEFKIVEDGIISDELLVYPRKHIISVDIVEDGGIITSPSGEIVKTKFIVLVTNWAH